LLPDPDARTAMSISGLRNVSAAAVYNRATVGRHQALPSREMSDLLQVEAADWESWVRDNDATVLDVREPDEWEQGTLPGALLISMSELVDRVEELPEDKPILCVCRSGGRSNNVAAFLSFNGYDAANMSGGMKALGMQD
jgi:rhodanese-related sulfurtransferase